MSRSTKEKRTKEEILRFLDRALEQEEIQAVRIQSLQADLDACRKKAENPRVEFNETAIPASKTSFRIDYYRTAENSPVKGIVEHLPSRATQSFIGEGIEAIAAFVARFMPLEKPPAPVKKQPISAKSTVEIPAISEALSPAPLQRPAEVSPRLRKLMPDLFPQPVMETAGTVAAIPHTISRVQANPFAILTVQKREYCTSVPCGEAFQLEIPMSELTDLQHYKCHLRLEVEALESGKSFSLAETCMPQTDNQLVPQMPITLQETGMYRITALLTRESGVYYRESRLLVVR